MSHDTAIFEYSKKGVEKPKPLFKQYTYPQESQVSSNWVTTYYKDAIITD